MDNVSSWLRGYYIGFIHIIHVIHAKTCISFFNAYFKIIVLSFCSILYSFCSMEKLHNIYEGSLIGSIFKVFIAHKNDFLNFNDREILFRQDRDWKEIEITDETGMLSFKEVDTEHGELVTFNGEFSLHGPIKLISEKMRPYIGLKSVLKIITLNKEEFILGDPSNPVSLTSSGESGKLYIDRSQIDYSFSVNQLFTY